jgi:hypothetical protein
MLNFALKYSRLGLSVIPLKPKGKEPLISWLEFQQRRMTEAEIVQHWTRVPNANIGIVTGNISGIAVVDLDGPEGLASASKLGLRSTATSITGNGKHLWYRSHTTVSNAVRLYPGIDIRGDGGFVVVPHSVHEESGKRYRWVGRGVTSVESLPPFPAMFAQTAICQISKLNTDTGKEEDWISTALKEMKDGNIDTTLHRICSRLRHDGYSAADTYTLLEPHAKRVGAEDRHLEAKIENVWNRYEPRKDERMGTGVQSIFRSGSEGSDGALLIHNPADNDSWDQYQDRRNGNDVSQIIYSGYRKLDAMFTGGLKSERLLTVGALTGHGKTNFGIGLAKNLCEQSKSVLYFSTEFGYKKIWQRYVATLKDPESFRQHKFSVCDSFTPNIGQVEEAILRIKPDVFIFDYIQHISKEKEAITDFMKGCQFLQRKYGCQGIILAQLNRGADWIEDGKRIEPRLSMLEGSATIEQASSRVLLLSMQKQTPEYYEINGYLLKNDDGDTGMVQFALYRNPYHLEEI